ncbi:MAG: hypothetical protein WD579_02580 [Candidatus Paceibacterota bacterium]
MIKTSQTKSFVSIILIVVIIILIGAFGYSTFVTENDTAGWETYRNEAYGIEFRHPPGWYVWYSEDAGISIYEREVGPGLPGVTRLMKIYRHKSKAGAEWSIPDYSQSGGAVTVLEERTRYTLVAWRLSRQIRTKVLNAGPQECYEPPCDWSEYENREQLMVRTYIPRGESVYSVSVEMSGEISADENEKKIDSKEEAAYLKNYKYILSTVKFLK